MLYLILKVLHIVGATLFFGAGMASAFFKFKADLDGEIAGIVFAQRNIVLADWLFTVPSGFIMPITGIWMADIAGYSLWSGWVGWGMLLYAVAGLTWLPAAFLQIKMRDEAIAARDEGRPLSEAYTRWKRIWFVLGIPAFVAAVVTIVMMVLKP